MAPERDTTRAASDPASPVDRESTRIFKTGRSPLAEEISESV